MQLYYRDAYKTMSEALLFLENEWKMQQEAFVPDNMWTKLIYSKGKLTLSFVYSYKDTELYFNCNGTLLFTLFAGYEKGLDCKEEFWATPSASEYKKHKNDFDEWFAGHIGKKFERYIFYLKKYKSKILAMTE